MENFERTRLLYGKTTSYCPSSAFLNLVSKEFYKVRFFSLSLICFMHCNSDIFRRIVQFFPLDLIQVPMSFSNF